MGFFRKVEDEIKDVGRKIDDEILQPVKNTVEAVIEDPKKLAAVAIAVAFPGAGAALGSALGLGTGVAAQVVGQTLLNTALNGGDVKSAVIAAAIPVVGKEVAGTLGTTLAKSGIEGTVNQVITRAATQGVTAAVLGKDPVAAFVLGGVSAGVNAIVPEIPGYKNLPPSAKNAVNSAIAAKLTGKDAGGAISQSLVNDAISWAKSEVADLKNNSAIKQLTASGMQGGDLSPQQVAQIRADLGLPPEAGGSYTGVAVAGPGDGAAGTFVPSWMSLRADERVIGTGTNDEGTKTYTVQRINPKNPEQFIEYSVERDPVTGTVWYGQDRGEASLNGSVEISASRNKPTVDWDAEEGPGSTTPKQPPKDEFASTDPLEGFPVDLLSKPSGTPTSTASITPEQVDKIVSDAIKSNPNLTAADVQQIVSDAITTIPNLTAGQVQTIVNSEMAKLPVSATPADVQKAVDASAANQSAATKQAISDATRGLATTGSLEATKAELAKEIQAARDIGLKGDAALQAGLDSLSAKMGVNQADVLKQLGESTATLRSEFSTGLADVTAAQKAEAEARAAQGKELQGAITGVAGQVTGLEGQLTAQSKAFALDLVKQGMDYKTALQTAIDAQTAVFGTQIGGVQSQIAANEAKRQADVQAQLAREAAAAQEAARQGKISNVRSTAAQGQQAIQQLANQLPQAFQQAQQITTPLYGAMEYFDPFGDPFGDPFATQKLKTASSTNKPDQTKMAAGGYIDDLLAEGMSVDDLLNLLR